MKKKLVIFLVMLLVLTSCGFQQKETKEVLRVATEKELSTLNYQKTASTLDMEQIAQFMEGLLAFDEKSEVIPAGAKSWEISDDGLTYQFFLRKDAKWADGTTVIAADYYFAWLQIIAENTSPFAYTLFPIKNAEKIYNGKLEPSTFGVKVVDDFTLEVTLEQPYLSFIYSLATATMFPIKESFYSDVGVEAFGTSKETILTNGAYTITDYNGSQQLFLEKNDYYWDKQNVHIPKVEVYVVKEAATRSVMFDDGKLDIMKLSTDYIEKYYNSGNQVFAYPTPKMTYLYLSGNTAQQNELLANLNLRRAISYGINKEILTDNILKDGSTSLNRLVPCEYAYVDDVDYCELVTVEEFSFDEELAKQYFQKAKEELQQSEISFEIYYQEAEGNSKVLENIKFQLEELLSGLEIKLVAAPVNAYSSTLRKNGVASAVQTWSGSFPNPELYLQILEKDSSFNFGKYNNEQFQKYYNEAMKATDKKIQFEIYGLAEKGALSAYMILPLYQNGVTYIINTDIKDFTYKMTLPNIAYKDIEFK